MKRHAFSIGACLLGVCLLSISFTPPPSKKAPGGPSGLLNGSPLGGGLISAKAVRVEYVVSNVTLRASTECHLINTSASQSLILGDVLLLGNAGISGPIITYGGLRNTIVPPLGHVILPIDNRIPGVQPWNGERPAGGVTNVVFTWSGPLSAANLSAVISDCVNWPNCDSSRSQIVVAGYDFWP